MAILLTNNVAIIMKVNFIRKHDLLWQIDIIVEFLLAHLENENEANGHESLTFKPLLGVIPRSFRKVGREVSNS